MYITPKIRYIKQLKNNKSYKKDIENKITKLIISNPFKLIQVRKLDNSFINVSISNS